MKLKMITGVMMILILMSMLTIAFNVPPILADAGTAELPDDNSTIQKADGDKPLNVTDSHESFASEGLNWNASAKENPNLYSVDETGWNSNKINEWADFAKVDDDSAELVIGVNDGKPSGYADIVALIGENGGGLVGTVSMGEIRAVVADIPLPSISSFVTLVQANGLSRYVEPNMKFKACFMPDDSYWSYQWGPRIIEADHAWNTTLGNSSVLVAVIDTGIDWNHPDLAPNYVALGYDWVNNDADPIDDEGHGTHCAGIVAAVINNSVGIAGLAQVRIMAEKGLDSGGWGTEDDLANAIIHAVDQGANILSNSWISYGDSILIHEAVKYAYDHGVLVVAAAGNDATSMKSYPAGYDEVIAVTATDEYDSPAWFTNFGEWVELAAPGVDIYSTVWDDSYTYMSGTSMSTPHVAGVAALILSQFPNMTRDQLRVQLRYTTDDLGSSGFDEYYGYGRVNARRAVEEAPPDHDLLILDWERPPYVEPEDVATFSTTVFNFGVSNESDITVQLSVNGSIVDNGAIGFLASGESATVNCSWSPIVEGMYNVTSYLVPVPGEMVTENNFVWAYVYVGFPVKAVVLDSAGNYIADVISNWEALNTNWHLFGSELIYVDYTSLSIDDITYDDIAATGADVLIISCAFDWEFTDSEIDAITRYVYEGHGLIATAGTLYQLVPNNNKLAPLFGLNETVSWDATSTDLLHLKDSMHPLFVEVPNPYMFREVGTAVPFDWQWDENELVGGTYVALGHYEESAIVEYKGLVYISPWLEIIPPYYHFHLQLLYNAITWSSYQKPEHELVVSLEAPTHLEPGASTLLNVTVSNLGLNNETHVELFLLINGTAVTSTTIPELLTGASYTINYSWAPTVEATYNVTAYAPPVTGENITMNNIATKMVNVRSVIGYVVFEEAHLPAYTVGSNPAADVPGGYSEFANYLVINGYMVSTIDPGTIIDAGVLAPVDVLVIVAPENSYSTSELDAIENWVKSGGRLLLISDWIHFGLQARAVAARFNINLRGDGICDSDENIGQFLQPYYDGANLLVHPITKGVTRVEMYAGDGVASAPTDEIPLIVTDSDGTAYWDSDGSPALGVSVMNAFDGGTAGSGRLIIMTDSNIWDSVLDVDGDGDVGFYDSDNEILALKSLEWLAVTYEHDLTVSLGAPAFLEPGDSSLINATVYNRGLSNETNVELYLLINGTAVNSATIPELLTGESYTINYLWTPTIEAKYNVTVYTPPMLGENVTANNLKSRMVYVRYIEVALISDYSELLAITAILDSMGIGYDVYNDNSIYLYTEDLELLLNYETVIFCTDYRHITSNEYTTLESYLSSGGSLLVTGYDSLVSDDLLRDIIRSATMGDNVGEPDLYVVDETHPIMNGPYGSFPAGYHISGLSSDCDAVEADTARMAVTVAELWDGYDKIIATDGLPGKVVYWNGVGPEDWMWNVDCEVIFKNTLTWFLIRYEHELAVRLDAPTFLEPGESSLLNATVYNRGSSNETSVELQLLINDTVVDSAVISELLAGSSYTLSHLWTPTVEGIYNLTAYAPPVPGENFTVNNMVSRFVNVQYLEVALFKNVNPWDYPANEEAFSLYGIAYAVFNSKDFGLVDLGSFSKVVIASDQDQAFYDAMDAYGWWFEDYVSSGGLLEIHAADFGWHGGQWIGNLPGGLGWVHSDSDYVTIVDPMHHVVTTPNPITDSELDGWSSSVHGYFSIYPTYSHIVIAEDSTGHPAYLEFNYGGGAIVASSQTLEWAYSHGYSLILENSLLYFPSLITYPHELAVFLNAPTFLEPSDSSLLNATVYNRGLNNETDVELFLLINGTEVESVVIPELLNGSSYTLSYLWIPTVEGIYNITAYAPPVPGENVTANNMISVAVLVQVMPTIRVSPSYIEVPQNTLFNVTILIENMPEDPGVAGVEFKLTWNSSVLEGVSIVLPPGHFMEPDGDDENLWILKNEIDNTFNSTHGRAWYAITFVDLKRAIEMGYAPKSGSGTLAVITFNSTALGETDLHFTVTKVANPQAELIPTKSIDGTVCVCVSALRGDINGDGIVDIYDVIILGGAFGSEPGDPRWNPDADLNSDGIIDIYDAIILAGNFQKTI